MVVFSLLARFFASSSKPSSMLKVVLMHRNITETHQDVKLVLS
jgi:hypothetical protein